MISLYRSCLGKKIYKTMAEARSRAANRNAKGWQIIGVEKIIPIVAYKCPYNRKHYHVGHRAYKR